MDALLHTGEHLGGTHRHVVDGDIARVGQVGIGQEDVRHQVDDVPAGEVRPGLLVVGLREAAHQILKDVAAVHRSDPVRAKVALGGGKLLDDQVEGVALHHALDDVLKIELGEDILDVGGKTRQVVPEVGLDIVRVGEQQIEGVLAGVIELVARCAGEEPVNDRQLLDLFILLPHGGMGGQQAVVEPLHHRHGEDHQAVLMGLEVAKQGVGDVPDNRSLFADIDPDFCQSVITHSNCLTFISIRSAFCINYTISDKLRQGPFG